MLAEAIEAEVEEYLEDHSSQRDEQGRHKVLRNGHMPVRQLLSIRETDEDARLAIDQELMHPIHQPNAELEALFMESLRLDTNEKLAVFFV